MLTIANWPSAATTVCWNDAVEERPLGLLTFLDALLQRGRHRIERARQFAQFAPLPRQPGPAVKSPRAQLLGRLGQHPHLAQDEALAAEPGRPQGKQSHHEPVQGR